MSTFAIRTTGQRSRTEQSASFSSAGETIIGVQDRQGGRALVNSPPGPCIVSTSVSETGQVSGRRGGSVG